jgi:hypothetical protein
MLFDVTISRVAYSNLVISVDAPSKGHAETKALMLAPDREFPNAHTAEYEALGSIAYPASYTEFSEANLKK